MKLDREEVRIQCDNHQTIRLVNSELATLSTKLRHVDIHNHWLRQEARAGKIEVVYTPSAELMADGLTKALLRKSRNFDHKVVQSKRLPQGGATQPPGDNANKHAPEDTP